MKHPVLVRILINRYEDTGEGSNTAAEALASNLEYLTATLIAKSPKDSLVALADRFDVVGSFVEDNGEECEGGDIGRWTTSFEIIARYVTEADTAAAAEQAIMETLEEHAGDVAGGSVEEWASDFSVSPLRKDTQAF